MYRPSVRFRDLHAMGQHAAWRHLKVDMPGGIVRGDPRGVPFGYLARLQRAFAAGPRARSRPLWHHRPLTGHELEMLRMLAAGRSNQAIARELVVTLDTVKGI